MSNTTSSSYRIGRCGHFDNELPDCAHISVLWDTPAGKDTFPRRNVVTSGLSQGTVVIEASSTSGAKMQAHLALEHGKKVFLLRSLVTDQKWAQDYVAKRGARPL